MDADFKPGERVQFCGEEAIVLANYGTSGDVQILGEGRCHWYWKFQGEAVTRVQ